MRKMLESDLDQVEELEKELFSSPWSAKDFLYELQENPFADLIVIEENGRIAAYCDLWILFEQAQIATIGVARSFQHQGYGQQMMDWITETALEKGCENISLEVRVSNRRARRLYFKNGYSIVNMRKDYYEDNHEDAYLMVKPLGGREE